MGMLKISQILLNIVSLPTSTIISESTLIAIPVMNKEQVGARPLAHGCHSAIDRTLQISLF